MMPMVFEREPDTPIRCVRVQIGEHWIERKTSGSWTPAQAVEIAMESVGLLTADGEEN